MNAPYSLASSARTHVFDMGVLPWQQTANPGLHLKPVRHDNEAGLYLGLVRFDAGVRSGLHQHQAVATSFVVDGGLTDYHGSIALHQAGINRKGSTHDAIAYAPTVLVSRLEGPVTYPPNNDISGVHAGSRFESFRNPAPDIPPEINVPVDNLAYEKTGVAGVLRQIVFDYAGTGSNHRMVQWTIRPESHIEFQVEALTELWVRGGNLTVNNEAAHANCFVVCEPGAKVVISSVYGALVLGWAEGPESDESNLFGF